MAHDMSDMRIETSIEIDAPPEAVWAAVTDISRMAERSDEVQKTEWVSGDGPDVGNVFQGYNKRESFEWDVPCHVVTSDAPTTFAYTIFEPDNPSSTWTYSIEDVGGRSRVTQTFQHGPNFSGVTMAIERNPDRRDDIVAGRSAALRDSMERGLEMLRAELER